MLLSLFEYQQDHKIQINMMYLYCFHRLLCVDFNAYLATNGLSGRGGWGDP